MTSSFRFLRIVAFDVGCYSLLCGLVTSILFFTSLHIWFMVQVRALGDSRLSSKFQVTVPRDIRNILELKAGDLLVFVEDGDEILLRRGEVKILGLRISGRRREQ